MEPSNSGQGGSHSTERVAGPEETLHQHPVPRRRLGLASSSLAALGIVYGDIGTSPLYAFRESFNEAHGIALSPANLLGILSLIFWALMIVISTKYLVLILRADNHGEGGILALTAMVSPMRVDRRGRGRWLLIMLGLFGASLLFGDGVIAPAISVLSAVEGLQVVTPFFQPYIIPTTLVILLGLFALQSRGTGGIGKVFGPVTLIWFVTLATLGIIQIFKSPEVLAAINPLYGFQFFVHNGWLGFLVLGSVFLVVTGGEALYADLGHFGTRPIRMTWFLFVLPALLLNYFGQGALLLRDPEAIQHPFFRLAPEWALLPLVGLATMATVIASQALISGVFSITRQAIQLGYLPRMRIEHTSARSIGQIYLPGVNWALMLACLSVVLGFRSSSALAAAYGVAVTTNMALTTLLFCAVAVLRWQWDWRRTLLLGAALLSVDLAFWGANIVKVPEGGWFPLLVAGLVFTLMTAWKRGRRLLTRRLRADALPFATFADQIVTHKLKRVPGTAVFMYSSSTATPPALLHNLKHNKIVHERVVLLSVETADIPHVPADKRIDVHDLGHGLYRVILHYGFMEDPDVPRDLRLAASHGLVLKPFELSYFLGRERVIATKRKGMAIWRERLFALMSRNSRSATDFFRLPPNQVVELGSQVEI